MKYDILHNGPISTTLETYSDLPAYKSGIYERTKSGIPTGGHGVAVFGWGLDRVRNKHYRILKNSWGGEFGENGFFKVYFGA